MDENRRDYWIPVGILCFLVLIVIPLFYTVHCSLRAEEEAIAENKRIRQELAELRRSR